MKPCLFQYSPEFFHSLSSKPQLVWRWKHSAVLYGRLAGLLLGADLANEVRNEFVVTPDSDRSR